MAGKIEVRNTMRSLNQTKKSRLSVGLLVIFLAGTIIALPASAQSPTVNAVLFYSPTCPACHKVIQEHLPGIIENYGSQLNLIGIDVTVQLGQELYLSAIERFSIPEERLGVPCLIIGDTVLVGAYEIPEQLPAIIDSGLVGGGIALPDIPGLLEALEATGKGDQASGAADEKSSSSQPELATPTPIEAAQVSSQNSDENQPVQDELIDNLQNGMAAVQPSIIERFKSDLTGNLISVFVLLAMVGSVLAIGAAFTKPEARLVSWPDWVIPTLSLIGLGVAIYLSYVEITHSEAVCGPVGNCNAVQQSPYAMLYGVLPVGVLGAIGYILILAAWMVNKYGSRKWHNAAALSLWGLAVLGVFFSIYLTFLEPFVIGSTCAWCISSAVIMTLILLASSGPARLAWGEISK